MPSSSTDLLYGRRPAAIWPVVAEDLLKCYDDIPRELVDECAQLDDENFERLRKHLINHDRLLLAGRLCASRQIQDPDFGMQRLDPDPDALVRHFFDRLDFDAPNAEQLILRKDSTLAEMVAERDPNGNLDPDPRNLLSMRWREALADGAPDPEEIFTSTARDLRSISHRNRRRRIASLVMVIEMDGDPEEWLALFEEPRANVLADLAQDSRASSRERTQLRRTLSPDNGPLLTIPGRTALVDHILDGYSLQESIEVGMQAVVESVLDQ